MKRKKRRKCYFCGKTTNLEDHHIIPKSIGGVNSKKNKKLICGKCHSKLHKMLDPVINYLMIYIKALQETDAPKSQRKIGFIRTNEKERR